MRTTKSSVEAETRGYSKSGCEKLRRLYSDSPEMKAHWLPKEAIDVVRSLNDYSGLASGSHQRLPRIT
jgi:hypothetical protein